MKNTLKDNPYLANIIKSINSNLSWIEEQATADRVGMLDKVIEYCNKKKMEIENDTTTSAT